MEIIILDINKKKEILERIEKRETLNRANLIITGTDIKIIDPIKEYKQKLREMCAIDYPIYKKVNCRQLNIEKLAKDICFNNGDVIVLPYFSNTKYWVKLEIGDKEKFLSYMLEEGYFNSFSIICLGEKIIYDIEFGEQEYEIRVSRVCDEKSVNAGLL